MGNLGFHLYPSSQGRQYLVGQITKIQIGCASLSMEKAMAPHSSTLAWKIPWMEESGGLQSVGSLRVRHD